MTLYKKIYRVEATRLPNHNYAYGMYFVTICTKRRLQWLGEIRNGAMQSNDVGKIVEQCWVDIPLHFPATLLDDFVIMPNHIHAILQPNRVETRDARVSSLKSVSLLERKLANDMPRKDGRMDKSEALGVSSIQRTSSEQTGSPNDSMLLAMSETRASHVSTMNEKQTSTPTLGIILNQFKGSATKKIRASGCPDFQWQPRYHDRVIRSKDEYEAIRKYMNSNPEECDSETIPWHADAASWSL